MDDLSDLDAANSGPVAKPQDDDLGDLHASNDAANRLKASKSKVEAERESMGTVGSNLDTAVRGVARAFPFMDDLAAVGDTATSYFPESVKGYIPGINKVDQSGEPLGQRYRENLARQRAINEADDKNRAIASYGGQAAGALGAIPLGGTAAAGRIAAALPRAVPSVVGRAVGAGALGTGYGAAYGLGAGDSLEDRLQRAKEGAIYGGVAGTLLPTFARGLSGTLGQKAATLGGTTAGGAGLGAIYGAATSENPDDRLDRAKTGALWGAGVGAGLPILATGVGTLGQKAYEYARAAVRPGSEAEQRVAAAFQNGANIGKVGMTQADIEAAQAAGQPVVAGDVGGEAVRRLARSAANASPEAEAALKEAVQPRYTDQAPRFSSFMKGLFKSDLNTAELGENLKAKAVQVNDPAFSKAYAKGANGIWDEDLSHMMQSPDMQRAVRDAMDTAQTSAVVNKQTVVKNPFTTDANGHVVLAQGPNGETATPSLEFWHHVGQTLNDNIGNAQASSSNNKARLLTGLRNNLYDKLDTAFPEFADARMGAYKFFGADNAVKAGGNFYGMAKEAPLNEAKAALAKMTPDNKKFFAQGLASEINQRAQNPTTSRDVMNMFDTPATREKMVLGLGADRANQIEAYLRRESMMNTLKTAVTGNSSTAKQLADKALAGGHDLTNLVTTPIGGAAAAAAYAVHEHGWDLGEIAKYGAGGFFTGLLKQHMKGANLATAETIGKMLASQDPAIIQRAVSMASKNPQVMDGLRKSEMALTRLAAEQGGHKSLNDTPSLTNEAPPLTVPVPTRASGGRINTRDYPAKKASHIEKQMNRICKAYGGELNPMLGINDDHIARALRVANRGRYADGGRITPPEEGTVEGPSLNPFGVDPDQIRQITGLKPQGTLPGPLGLFGADTAKNIVEGTANAATLPGDVYQGRVDLGSDEGLGRVINMAGTLAQTGLPMAEAGAAGIFGGKLTRDPAGFAKLGEGKDMLTAGANPRDTYLQTGAWKGPEGMMRYEIPDYNATLKTNAEAAIRTGKNFAGPLKDFVDHPEFFKAYPDLADTIVLFDPSKTSHHGYFAPGSNLIKLYGHEPSQVQSVLLHEMQHAVQKKEGFTPGWSREGANNEATALLNKAEDLGMPRDQRLAFWNRFDPYDAYRRAAGEIEARAVQRRAELTPEQASIFSPDLDMTAQYPRPKWIVRTPQ